jgi:sulfur carrier protein
MTVANIITITLNGKPRELEGATNVTSLLDTLGVNSKQVAVALNGVVVRRVDWAQTEVADGDAVEIVRAVGGG